ncbi:hypothetical protein [Actinomycetospora sp. NBRC 106378]|uniref:hypothetical protein n=1 Tax=Actinomycetospora sp. NBRC 106378 TaxID=3032208 RepID=UPI0024A1FE40|nr:hypothetical protein [Actinomycetospora sp. NBRC 106378]GLZ51257.1 hypothetical protein Acsp07_08740 [Actinomycetospora sp. NBRC 106378]
MAERSRAGDDVPGPGETSGAADLAAPTTAVRPAEPPPPHRTVLDRLDEGPLVVTGLDGEQRSALVEGLRGAGRRVRVVAPTPALARAWRAALGEEQLRSHRVAAGVVGSVEEIAEQLAATPQDAWLTGLLGPDDPLDPPTATGPTPPLDAADLTALRRLLVAEHGVPGVPGESGRRTLDPARRHQALPPPAELPPEPHVEQLAAELLDVAGPAGSPAREASRALIAALACLPPDAAVLLGPTLVRIDAAVVALGRGGEDAAWARATIDAVLDGRAAPAWTRATAALAAVDRVPELDRGSGAAQVRVTDDTVDPEAAAATFDALAAFLTAGGSLRRMFKSDEQRAAEALLPGLAINRVDPMSADGAAAVADHLRLRHVEAAVAAALAPLGRVVRPAEQRALMVHRLLSLREITRRIADVLDAVGVLRGLLVGLPAEVRPSTDSLPAVGRVVATGRRLTSRPSADLARRELGDVVARLQDGRLPAEQAPELRATIAALLRLDVEGYAEAADAVDEARSEQRDLRRSDALAARLAEWPALLEALDADTSDATWVPREGRWSQAWSARRATAWLARQEPVDSVVTVPALLGDEDVDLLVVGPVRDDLPPGFTLPERVVDIPGPDDGSRLLVVPTRPA